MKRDWPQPVKPRKTPSAVYIRFGRWESRSYNHTTGEREKGVSVYPAVLSNGVVSLDASDFDIPVHCIQGRCAFPVTGEVAGIGSDGEPVLRKVKALAYAIDPMSLPCGFNEK